MNSSKLKLLVVLEATAIVFLAIVLASIWSTSGSSSGSTNMYQDDGPFSDYGLLDNGTYVVVKELITKDMAGSMNFTVDEDWSEIAIYVRGIGEAYVNFTVTPPGYPSGATTVNGTALPFMSFGLHVEEGSIGGQGTPLYAPLYNQTFGDYTLHYDVHGGPVKIYIVETQLADL
jgi:hypothetical protein